MKVDLNQYKTVKQNSLKNIKITKNNCQAESAFKKSLQKLLIHFLSRINIIYMVEDLK